MNSNRTVPGATGPLVGRAVELAELIEVYRGAEAGRMSSVILGGEAGVGKSRLVAELGRHAAAEGATVLLGRAIDIAEAPPFWPVVAALRHAMRAGADPEVAELIAPALGRLDESANETRTRGWTLELIRQTVASLAEIRTVVLGVDDLHAADRSTRDLLVYLVANLTQQPLLLVVTYRNETPTAPGQIITFVSEMRRHRQVIWREVSPLDRASTAQLLAQLAPDRRYLEPLIWRRSGGNAFIIEETIRAALAGDSNALPGTLRELVLGRIAGLSPPAKHVTRAVATATGPMAHALLARVLGWSECELLSAVREAVAAGVVVVEEACLGYRLRHGLMTEVVAGELLPGERIQLHRQHAVALATQTAADPTLYARLAHHWHHAGAPAQELIAVLDAARACERMHGYAEAHRHWLRAAKLTDQPRSASVAESSAYCVERAAAAADLAGDHDVAVALLQRRLAGLSSSADRCEKSLLTARMAGYLAGAGQTSRAVRTYRVATALLRAGDAPAEHAEILAGYAGALVSGGDFRTARTVAMQALSLSREARATTIEARVLATLGFSLGYLADTAAGSDALVEALTVAEYAKEPAAVGEAYLRRAELLSGPLNDLENGVRCALAGAARVSELGLSRSAGAALLALAANGLFRLGRWDEAESTVRRAWALKPSGAEAIEIRLARVRLTVGRGQFSLADDDLEAVELLTSSSMGPRHRIPLLILRAGLQMWRGLPGGALRYVDEGLSFAETGAVDMWLLAALLWHGHRAWAETTRLGLDPPPSELLRRLRGHRADLARRGTRAVPAIREVLITFDAMCAAETGRAQGRSVPAAWTRVAQLCREQNQPYPTAYAHLRTAEALLAKRPRSAEAADELRQAARGARSLGAAPLLNEIVDLARRARIELPDSAEAAPPTWQIAKASSVLDTLTVREREVLTELATGLTNREIGRRLFISEKTVGIHVSRIYTKIGVRNRLQASAVLNRSAPHTPAGN